MALPRLDPRVLVSIVGNLIDNALDAASGTRDARVEVRFRQTRKAVQIEVADTGAGVPAGRRIFDDGFTTKAPRQGVHRGIGLALVHRLVIQAGGSIRVRNEDGAVFKVSLPTIAVRREAATGPERRPAPRRGPAAEPTPVGEG